MIPDGGAAARLVLASRSPQRRAILETLGVPFLTDPADVVELTAGEPVAVARENALRKATAVARRRLERGAPALPVLGVDTLVALDGRIYGKPVDAGAARATLRALSGACHEVVSGLALVVGGPGAPAAVRACAVTAVTAVRFRALDDSTLDWYVATGEWRERAGGYAIQERGMALVAAIDGDHANVVGLPVAALLALWPSLLGPGSGPSRPICSDFCS